MEGRYQFLQETVQETTHQRLHTLGRKGASEINKTEERWQERDIDPLEDRQTSLHVENLGQYNHKTGLTPRKTKRRPSEQNVGRNSQNSTNLSNANQIADIWNTLL